MQTRKLTIIAITVFAALAAITRISFLWQAWNSSQSALEVLNNSANLPETKAFIQKYAPTYSYVEHPADAYQVIYYARACDLTNSTCKGVYGIDTTAELRITMDKDNTYAKDIVLLCYPCDGTQYKKIEQDIVNRIKDASCY